MKKKKRKICRRCKHGCGQVTKSGKKYIKGHHLFGNTNASGKRSEEHKKNMMGNTYGRGNKGKQYTEERKKNISLGLKNRKLSKQHKKNISLGMMDKKLSKEHILNMALSRIKLNPNYKYGCEWYDKEYKKDIRKDYCENANCKGKYKRLGNHHIDLDKKNCNFKNIMTLCTSCHVALHNKLRKYKLKDLIIINRPDHVSYIHKPTRKIIRVEKMICKN